MEKREVEATHILPPDSELRKPWKEMNPLLAIEEAKSLPIPRRMSRDRAEKIIQGRGIAEGTQEYDDVLAHLTSPRFELTPEAIKAGHTRCPCCRVGYVRSNTCPCCCGFVFVPDTRITGFLTSLNEVTETEKIDKAAREVVKRSREKRERVKKKALEGVGKKQQVEDMFGGIGYMGKAPKGD